MTDLCRGRATVCPAASPDSPPSTTRACTGCSAHPTAGGRARPGRVGAGGPSQSRWREEALHLLAAHRVAEREVLTPEALRPAGPETLAAAEELNRADDDLDRAAAAVAAVPIPSPDLTSLGDRLAALVARHA